MTTKTLFINLNSYESLKKADKQKKRLENKGFKLVRETCTFTQARLYYDN